MLCKQCGNEIAPDCLYCGKCGALNVAAPGVADRQQSSFGGDSGSKRIDPAERELSKTCLTFGILVVAFASSFCASFMGIVFGAITMSKIRNYTRFYPLEGRAKVARILGKIGLILGIVSTVLALFYYYYISTVFEELLPSLG